MIWCPSPRAAEGTAFHEELEPEGTEIAQTSEGQRVDFVTWETFQVT